MRGYQNLRDSVRTLSLSAEEQAAFLDRILGHLTPDGDASGYGNDELGMLFGDSFLTADYLIECGVLTPSEKAALEPLNSFLVKWSGDDNADFWQRSALFEDARWDEARALASKALVSLPDEQRAYVSQDSDDDVEK